jgi:uncharacterized cofD-like protein
MAAPARPRVVTIGGGHGQAALVRALVRFDCDVTALVSVTDDGGCSGRLREELQMPPPGDVRRCLLALSTRPRLAARFDERDSSRSAGNLVLAEMFERLGGLQAAVDWAGRLLGCVGRVVPLAETAGVLYAYDEKKGPISGETKIERESASTLVVNVEGPEEANPEAKRALASADVVFIGPGSFVGSTLAALTTGDIAASVVEARARRVLVQNLGREAGATYGVDQHERIVRDHLVIKSGGDAVILDVLSHSDEAGHRANARPDGSTEYLSRLRRDGESAHDEDLLAQALAAHFGFAPARPRPGGSEAEEAEADALFEATLAAARRRLRRDVEP